MPTAQKFNCCVFFSLCDHVKCTTWMKCEEKVSARFIFHSPVSWNSGMETGRVMLNSVYKRLVRLAYRNRTLLFWNRRAGIREWTEKESIYDFTNFDTVFVKNIRNVSVMLQWCCIVFCFTSTILRVKLAILHPLQIKEKTITPFHVEQGTLVLSRMCI